MTTPTQVVRPWRTTVRTVFQLLVGLATLIPLVVTHVYSDTEAIPAALAQAVVVSTAVTRLMALPAVETFLADYLPWLSADPDADVVPGEVLDVTDEPATDDEAEGETAEAVDPTKYTRPELVAMLPAGMKAGKKNKAALAAIINGAKTEA